MVALAIWVVSTVWGPSAVSASDPEGLAFSDQTESAGLAAADCSGATASLMGSGGVVGDFNNDGWQDLFWLGAGARPDMLFINNQDGTFTDQAAAWGVDAQHRGIGAAAGDYDGDGRLDVFITSHGPSDSAGPGHHRLYRNDGEGAFTNVAVGVGVDTTSPGWADGFGAAWGDSDRDGDLDLAVSGWVLGSDRCIDLDGDGGPIDPDCNGTHVFRNDHGENFAKITLSHFDSDLADMHAFSPVFVDADEDRCPELLWAGDFKTSRYFTNDGTGRFLDRTNASGVGLDGNGMGQAIGDFNNDGLLDWYVTSIYTVDNTNAGVPGTGNMLYVGQGEHAYEEISAAAGVKDGGWGWGAVAVDLDHDGFQDIVETNGWDRPLFNGEFIGEQSYVFMNNGDLTFTDVAAETGLTHDGQGRGLVHFDYDNDGDQDIVIFTHNGPLKLYRNDLSGPNANWLRVFLDTANNERIAPDGVGAKVVVTVGGTTMTRWIHAGASYLGHGELSAHFGLGAAGTVDQVRVEWPNGQDTILTGVAPNQTMTIAAPELGDLDADGVIGGADLGLLLLAWGSDDIIADLTADGVVNAGDLGVVLGAWD